jgi:carboxyl-terminal processing protease
MKVTTGMFFLPGGNSTQKVGVGAHVRVLSPLDGIEVGEGSLDYSLAPESVPPFLSLEVNGSSPSERWKAIDEAVLAKLRTSSTERCAKDPVMAEIRKDLDEASKKDDVVKLSELRKKSKETEKEKDYGKDEKGKPRTRFEYAHKASVAEAVNIAADLVTLEPAATYTGR